MSTVLIGIIGVVLFIGLALAGALILGSDFNTASAASQGAAVMSQIKQTSDAVNMYKLKLGVTDAYSVDTTFLVPRFLKSVAQNTTNGGRANPTSYIYQIHLNDTVWPDAAAQTTQPANYVMAGIGADTQAQNVCQAINDTYGITGIPTIANAATAPAAAIGCVIGSGTYMAYQRL